jgi:hypothetical protein
MVRNQPDIIWSDTESPWRITKWHKNHKTLHTKYMILAKSVAFKPKQGGLNILGKLHPLYLIMFLNWQLVLMLLSFTRFVNGHRKIRKASSLQNVPKYACNSCGSWTCYGCKLCAKNVYKIDTCSNIAKLEVLIGNFEP